MLSNAFIWLCSRQQKDQLGEKKINRHSRQQNKKNLLNKKEKKIAKIAKKQSEKKDSKVQKESFFNFYSSNIQVLENNSYLIFCTKFSYKKLNSQTINFILIKILNKHSSSKIQLFFTKIFIFATSCFVFLFFLSIC